MARQRNVATTLDPPVTRVDSWNGLTRGDVVDVVDCEGDFTFHSHCTNRAGTEWIDVYGGAGGTVNCRSFTPDRVTRHAGTNFGVEVVRARKRRGWTRERLASNVGLTTSALSRIEHGRRSTAAEVALLRTALGLTTKSTYDEETDDETD